MKKTLVLFAAILSVAVAQASYLYWQIDSNTPVAQGISLSDYNMARLVAYSSTQTYDQYAQVSDGKMTTYREFNLSTIESGDTSAYSFWIELGTYDSTGSGSFTTQAATWGERKTYAQLLDESYISTGTLSGVPTAQIWHGGTVSVPEPTSAMLMLFGAAFLGLKRKNRRIA